MTDLTRDTTDEARRALEDLAAARLPAPTWAALPAQLEQLGAALDARNEEASRAALVPVSRAVFEAKVRSRLGQHRPRAAAVIPTKRTPALPAVGAVCGAVLLALGWQLGGGLVLAATAALALFIVGVAVAGMQSNADRAAGRRGRTAEPDTRVAAPEPIRAVIEDLLRHTV